MDIDELLEFANQLTSESIGRPLNTLETRIFKGSWDRHTYEKIAEPTSYSVSHVKDEGAELWKCLSTALGKQVTKTNFQVVLEREYEQRSRSSSQSSPVPLQTDEVLDSPFVKDIQPPELDSNFVGRMQAIADLDHLTKHRRVVLIHSRGGEGKTTLAKQYLRCRFGDRLLEFIIAKEPKDISSVESLLEERLKQLGEEPGKEFGVSLDRLKYKLKTEPIGVLVDNLEPALDVNGQFIEPHRRYIELLRVLADPEVRSLTLITSRDRIYEPAVEIEPYFLKGLSVEAWHEFFQGKGVSVEVNSRTLAKMHQAYSGNAKAMTLLCGVVQKDYEGSIDLYWSDVDGDLLVNGELRNLISEQFNRLQIHNPSAYRLLIRMGCYRYQDVPTLLKEGLVCLLWDANREQHQRLIQSLKDRGLVEFKDGKYWLHPEIRAEAVSRLRANTEEWKTTNCEAAKFWTESVKKVDTLNEAKKALEAYYHYLEINEFEEAGTVLIKEREDKWRTDDPLGCSLYTLGFLELNIFLISKIINEVKLNLTLCKLYNILGDSYWLTGQLKKAISSHKRSGEIAAKSLIENQSSKGTRLWNKLKRYQVVSSFNIGLCKIDLWEVKEAVEIFEEVLIEAKKESLERYFRETQFCLAFLNSFLGNLEKASQFAKEAYCLIDGSAEWARHDLSKWSLGYCFVFLGTTYKNLRNTERAFDLFRGAISFAEESHYPQVKAKALIGLAELYRDQQDFEKALAHHPESIQLLETIGAKCDLAEAYFQLGLTHQARGKVEQSRKYADRAIQLYREMQAPKQIERVQQALANAAL